MPSHSEDFQLYLDETDQQIELLLETLTRLQNDSADVEHFTSALRLIHAMQGAADILGLGGISTLIEHLDRRMRFLQPGEAIQPAAADRVRLCIYSLRRCNRHLREGGQLPDGEQLLERMKAIELRIIS